MSESTIAQVRETLGSLASAAASTPGVLATVLAVHGAGPSPSGMASYAAAGSSGTVGAAQIRVLREATALTEDEIEAGAALCEAFGVRPEDLSEDDFEELRALWR